MPLALRLALVLSAAVLVVLLAAGAVVNRVVSQSFEDVVTAQQTEHVEATADALSELLRQGGTLREARAVLVRLARSLDAPVTVVGPGGEQVGHWGRPLPPDVPSTQISASVMVADREVALVVATVPVRPVDRPFLRLFNAALLVAGFVSVAVIAGVAVWMARRQTRPLRDVAAAAARLGAGDLSARATGGGDRESQELAGAFNSMAGRLEQSEALRRRAASDMAHDLATPATVLEGQLQAMIDGVVPRSRANLDAAAASAAALGSVIVQLGELASAEAAPLQARPEPVSVAAAVADAAAALEGLYREREVTLTVEPAPAGDLLVRADPLHLGRALRNVLTNSAQHTPSGKSVRVETSAPPDDGSGGRVQVRVTDQGPGIPEADLPHIFERFYRSDPARTAGAGPGAGIGLTIARELLTASGGVITVERSGPDGTTFLLALPRA